MTMEKKPIVCGKCEGFMNIPFRASDGKDYHVWCVLQRTIRYSKGGIEDTMVLNTTSLEITKAVALLELDGCEIKGVFLERPCEHCRGLGYYQTRDDSFDSRR